MSGEKRGTTAGMVNRQESRHRLWTQIKRQKILILMSLAPLVMLIIFKYVPMYGILIAFKKYKSAREK